MLRFRSSFAPLLLLAVFCMGPAANAYDQHLTSTLYASGYSVRAANGTLIDRRNIMEELYLSAWNIIPGSDDPYYDGPRLSVQIDLRMGGDYGVSNREMDSARLQSYVPGLSAMYLDAVFAWVELSGLANHHLNTRLGRIVRADVTGYNAFDGAEVELEWRLGIRASGYWGYEVKGAKPFGYDNLALDGVDNAGRDDLDDAYFASLTDEEPAMVFGGELAFTHSSHLDAAVAFRQAGRDEALQQRTVAGRIAAGTERIRTFAKVVLNPVLDRHDFSRESFREGTLVTEATAEVAVSPWKPGWWRLSYDLYRPAFMLDSIFNVFGHVGRRDVTIRYEHRSSARAQWAAWSNVRFADDENVPEAAEQDGPVIGGGGGMGLNLGTFSRRLSSRIRIENELGAVRLGIDHELGHHFINDKLWLSVRSAYWHVHDELLGASKNIAGYVLSANHQFSQKARAKVEFENYYGSGTPRFAVVALFQLDVWR